jgi:hypothetical protein
MDDLQLRLEQLPLDSFNEALENYNKETDEYNDIIYKYNAMSYSQQKSSSMVNAKIEAKCEYNYVARSFYH